MFRSIKPKSNAEDKDEDEDAGVDDMHNLYGVSDRCAPLAHHVDEM